MRTFPGIPKKENQGGGGTKERGELYHEGGQPERRANARVTIVIVVFVYNPRRRTRARRPSHARCAGAFCAAFLLLLYDLAGYSLPPPAENGAHEKALATAAHSPAKPRPPPTPCFEAGPSKKSCDDVVCAAERKGQMDGRRGDAKVGPGRRTLSVGSSPPPLSMSRSAEHAPSTLRSACSRIRSELALQAASTGVPGSSSSSTILPLRSGLVVDLPLLPRGSRPQEERFSPPRPPPSSPRGASAQYLVMMMMKAPAPYHGRSSPTHPPSPPLPSPVLPSADAMRCRRLGSGSAIALVVSSVHLHLSRRL